jgi:hypothetical protein
MSFGGDGVLGYEVPEILHLEGNTLPFIPRRLQAGGRLLIEEPIRISHVPLRTCCLCGGIIKDDASNYEHPLPQWLHRYTDLAEQPSNSFQQASGIVPTWRQLSLLSHTSCNSQFERLVERPAIGPLKNAVEGGSLSSSDFDRLFDWCDKVIGSAALMGAAINGQRTTLGYEAHNFPNKRIGAFDRIGIFFRVRDKIDLDLWHCTNEAFLSTPSSIALQVKDLIMVYVTGNFLLSRAFGLGFPARSGGDAGFVGGSGKYQNSLGHRVCRIPSATIIAQAMRRQHTKEGLVELHPALNEDGDGYVHQLTDRTWERTRSCSFDDVVSLSRDLGDNLAALEVIEWLLLSKELDRARYGDDSSFFMRSYKWLLDQKQGIIDLVKQASPLLPINYNDRL